MYSVYVMNTISVLICLMILFNITYGSCRKEYTEQFTDGEMGAFQSQLLADVKTGKIDNAMIKNFIKEKKITKEDLDSIITFVSKYAK